METSVESVSKKKGRKAREERRVGAVDESKGKFIVSFRGQPETAKIINEALARANDKSFGRKVEFTDLVKILFRKINDRDIQKLQEMSLNRTQKIELMVRKYNETHGLNLSVQDYVLHKSREF